MSAKTPLTVKGAELLRAELHELKTVQRPAIIAAIAEARAHGDLSENAEYAAERADADHGAEYPEAHCHEKQHLADLERHPRRSQRAFQTGEHAGNRQRKRGEISTGVLSQNRNDFFSAPALADHLEALIDRVELRASRPCRIQHHLHDDECRREQRKQNADPE